MVKKIKASSQKRYDSLMRTHFGGWLEQSISELGNRAFAEHCHAFAQTKGSALVEVGRGIVTALIKYLNAVHGLSLVSPFTKLAATGLSLVSPFTKLAATGLMPERSQPRARVLQEVDLPAWRDAVDKLG